MFKTQNSLKIQLHLWCFKQFAMIQAIQLFSTVFTDKNKCFSDAEPVKRLTEEDENSSTDSKKNKGIRYEFE